MSTTYTVEVPAGTKAANGNALDTATKFTFETPALTMVSRFPVDYQPQHLDVPMFVLFDQKIDAQAVLSKITVTANGKAVQVTKIDDAEIKKILDDKKANPRNKQLAALVDDREEGNEQGWPLPRVPLRAGAADRRGDLRSTIPAGTPSARRARTLTPSPAERSRSAPIRRCKLERSPPAAYGRTTARRARRCHAASSTTRSTPTSSTRRSWSTASPDIPGVQRILQNELGDQHPWALTKARTVYKVRVSGGLLDQFGQTLGKDEELTFKIGNAQPNFFGPQRHGRRSIPPRRRPRSTSSPPTTSSSRSRLYKVDPPDRLRRLRQLHPQPAGTRTSRRALPGTKVFDQLVKTAVGKNQLVETTSSMAPALSNGLGHALAIVEPYPWKEAYEPPRLITWAQSTKLGIDAHVDGDNLIAYATDLASGKPMGGLELEMRPSARKAQSDDKGLATIALPSNGGMKGAGYLLAKRGTDVAFVAESSWYDDSAGWVKQGRGSSLAWYVVDDRKLYKPGEEVHLKGWLRTIDYGKNGDIGAIDTRRLTADHATSSDSRGNEIAQGLRTSVSAVGAIRHHVHAARRRPTSATHGSTSRCPKDPWTGGDHVSPRLPARRSSAAPSSRSARRRRKGRSSSAAPAMSPSARSTTPVVRCPARRPPGTSPRARDLLHAAESRRRTRSATWDPWWNYVPYDDEAGAYDAPSPYKRAEDVEPHRQDRRDRVAARHPPRLPERSSRRCRCRSPRTRRSPTSTGRPGRRAPTIIVHPATAYVGLRTKKPFVEKGTPFDARRDRGRSRRQAPPRRADRGQGRPQVDYEYKKGRYQSRPRSIRRPAR
jgi:hypothetical protein